MKKQSTDNQIQTLKNELRVIKEKVVLLNIENATLKKELHAQEQMLNTTNTIFSRLPGSIYWKDKNGVYLGCSDDMCDFLGMSREQVIGKSDDYIGQVLGWPKNISEKAMKDDQYVISHCSPLLNIEEIPFTDKNGRIINQITSKVPLLDENQQIIGVLGFSVDITERKKMEEDLRNAKEAAEAASRAKTAFIANISHDTRTPLSGVIGLSQALEAAVVTDEDRIKYAKMIHESGEELLELSERSIESAIVDRMGDDDVIQQSFDIRKLIYGVTALERPTAEMKHLTLIEEIDAATPVYLVSDEIKLKRIILNLIGNAIKFTEKGCVKVSVRLLRMKKNKAHVEFAVEDTGIGIAKKDLKHIFDQYFKVIPSYRGLYKGFGLGLHLAQKFAKLLGGKIDVQSEAGLGAKFSFVLNMKIGQKPETTDTYESMPLVVTEDKISFAGRDSSKLKVLLVEDNKAAMMALNLIMKPFDVQVSQAFDAETAFDMVKKQSFDLVMSDVGLPEKQGDELAMMIRALEKEEGKKPITLIGCTGHVGQEEHAMYLKAGMDDVCSKPMTPEKMKELMTRYGHFHKADIDSTKSSKIKNGGALGLDLPDAEEQLFEIDHYPLLDLQVGIKILGDETVLKQIIKGLREDSIDPDLPSIIEAHRLGNWETVEKLAHKIKGGACYGTVRLYYALLYMERYLKAGHTHCAEALYEQMLRVIDETSSYLDDFFRERTLV